MKKLLVLLLLLIPILCSADEFQIPFACYPKQVQQDFALYGYKLDLSGNDRTPDSWGFLENKGDNYIIYTYRAVTKQDLETMRVILLNLHKKEVDNGKDDSKLNPDADKTPG